jgi:hypothetical protein
MPEHRRNKYGRIYFRGVRTDPSEAAFFVDAFNKHGSVKAAAEEGRRSWATAKKYIEQHIEQKAPTNSLL